MKRTTKSALFSSTVALLLCFAMLIGTTYAWFTDSVTSQGNIIASGSLDIELYHANKGTDGKDERVGDTTKLFTDVDSNLWEPGAMAWEKFTAKNEGTLDLKYAFSLYARNATEVDGVSFANMLKVAVVDNNFEYTRENVAKITDWQSLATFTLPGELLDGETVSFGVILWWQPSELDNIFNMKNEKQGETVSVDVSVVLSATQLSSEGDSFGNDYDQGATFPKVSINLAEKAPVAGKTDVQGLLTEAITVGRTQGDLIATVPAGVQLANGATDLNLTVKTVEKSDANITLDEDEELLTVDVHMDGVSETNTVPMLITLKDLVRPGLNDSNIKLYHVEDGITVQMTAVATAADLVAHNQFYYNAATGDIVLSMASFSAVAVVADEIVHWDGTSANAFAAYEDGSLGTGAAEKPYLIANAGQLAYFRDLVDGGKTFKGEFVKLANDVILNHHDELKNQFDPIGWGYAYNTYNSGSADGKVFMGTFDGAGHAIHGLYQNGWDLEAKTGTDYTYTNCGFGLFASVQDATIKNLTMKHANVVVECVEAGVLVGLAQGNCTFENVYIYHASIANYQRPAGGVVGEVSPKYENGVAKESIHKFINVHVGSSCTVGTLWGDFDAPVGGVIGAYWDDSDKTKVVMDRVDVSCVLDVYNDVTSAYQWYAYRRAGMLIGNSDRAETVDGRTVASTKLRDGSSYLTCTNCVVIYDTWREYSYCQFTNDNNPGRNYPWVRVEPGRNNPSYSNPRYGHPTDAAGNQVIDDIHLHEVGDACTLTLSFNQLYGGGQGVYGQATHDGVSEGKYTITFIGGDGDIADVIYVTNDAGGFSLEGHLPNVTRGDATPLKWEDANGNSYAEYKNQQWKFTPINEGNLVDIVLYPEWTSEFNIYFLDHNGKTLHYETFKTGQTHTLDKDAIEAARLSVQKELDDTEKVIQVKWDTNLNTINFASATDDIVVKMELTLSNLSITLEPVYDSTTNRLTHYKVVDVNNDDTNKSINIPSHVGVVPVTEIVDGAFDGFDNLTAVKIPSTITSLGAGMFPGSLFNKQTVTIYYTGNYEQWQALIAASGGEWDDGLGDGSRVFFLDANGKVDISKGYVEYFKKNVFSTPQWYLHNHPYDRDNATNPPENCPAKGHYKGFTEYTAEGRPDRAYWVNTDQQS